MQFSESKQKIVQVDGGGGHSVFLLGKKNNFLEMHIFPPNKIINALANGLHTNEASTLFMTSHNLFLY